MLLYKEIICQEIGKIMLESFANTKINYKEMVDLKSIQSLQKIKAIIENDSLSDFDCIEKIVRVFENMGSSGGNRHDFG